MKARAPSTIFAPCSLNSSKKLPSRGNSLPNSMGVSRLIRVTGLSLLGSLSLEALARAAETREALDELRKIALAGGRMKGRGVHRQHGHRAPLLEVLGIGVGQVLQVVGIDRALHRQP